MSRIFCACGNASAENASKDSILTLTTLSRPPSLGRLIFGDGTPTKALVTALIVGTILTLINHGDYIVHGEWPPAFKIILTYLTPYCVTTWGAATGKRAQWRRQTGQPE